MYFRLLSLLIGYLLTCALTVGLAMAQTVEPLSLDQAVSKALSANPGLAAIDARAKALAERPEQLMTLPDPVVSANIVNLPLNSLSFTQEAMTQVQLGIAQTLPYPGKLALRAQVAQHEADAAAAEVEEKQLQLVRDVKTVWWNLFYLDRALEVIARNQTLLSQLVQVAETRYTVGRSQQQDVLLAQLELSKLSDQTILTQNLRENEGVRLNVLMDQPVATPIRLPIAVEEALPTLKPPERLQQQAKASRPTLTALSEQSKAAHRRVDLAKKGYAPDFKVGAVYGLRRGHNADGSNRADFGSILFSMNLPLYASSKQDRAVAQQSAEWTQKKYQLHDRRNQVASHVWQAATDYSRSRERTALFQQEIIPQARQTVDAMLAGYQVGKVDFLSLIRAQTTLYDYENQYWKALSAANQAKARLVAAVGEDTIYGHL